MSNSAPAPGGAPRSRRPNPITGTAMVVGTVAVVVMVGARLSAAVATWWWLVLLGGLSAGMIELLRGGITARSAVPVGQAPARSTATPLDLPAPVGSGSATLDPAAPLGEVARLPRQPGASATSVDVAERPAASQDSTAAIWAPDLDRSSTIGDTISRPTARPGEAFVADVVWVPKSSHSREECEDAWAINAASGRVAIADGASSAFMSREWATALAAQFIEAPLRSSDLREWLSSATGRWAGSDAGRADGGPWWVDASQERGSAATLVGLEVRADGERRLWRSAAVGDSCVFHLGAARDGFRPLLSFPVDQVSGFGQHPDLLPTIGDGALDLPVVRLVSGEFRSGDVFVLATDALAQWLVAHSGMQGVWDWIAAVGQSEFEEFVIARRRAGELHDDDTTLLRVQPS